MADETRPARTIANRSREAVDRYRSVLTVPGSRSLVFSAAAARLGVAMTGLGLVWTVSGLSGSFALAGLTTAVFAGTEAAVGPQAARLIDRWGQSRILPVLIPLHALGVVMVVLGSLDDVVVLVVGGAVIAGAAVPQPGALSAARWTYLLNSGDRLRTAFSLEAIVNDVVFLSGPTLVTIFSGFAHPYSGTILATAFVVAGGVWLATQRKTDPPPRRREPRERPRKKSSLATRGLVSTCGVTLGLGFFFGAAPVVVTAYAAEQGFGPAAGSILALTSVASLAAGLLYGAMRQRWRPGTVQLDASVLLVTGIAVSTVWLSLPALIVGLVLAGASIAPINVASAQIVERTVPRAVLTQGFTWINTASAVGIALAAAVAGVVIESAGVQLALISCCALVLVAPLSGLLGRSTSSRYPTDLPEPDRDDI